MLYEGVYCSVYNEELHFHCAGITEMGYRKLAESQLRWRCSKCKTPGLPLQPLLSKPDSEFMILDEIRALSFKLAPLDCVTTQK